MTLKIGFMHIHIIESVIQNETDLNGFFELLKSVK